MSRVTKVVVVLVAGLMLSTSGKAESPRPPQYPQSYPQSPKLKQQMQALVGKLTKSPVDPIERDKKKYEEIKEKLKLEGKIKKWIGDIEKNTRAADDLTKSKLDVLAANEKRAQKELEAAKAAEAVAASLKVPPDTADPKDFDTSDSAPFCKGDFSQANASRGFFSSEFMKQVRGQLSAFNEKRTKETEEAQAKDFAKLVASVKAQIKKARERQNDEIPAVDLTKSKLTLETLNKNVKEKAEKTKAEKFKAEEDLFDTLVKLQSTNSKKNKDRVAMLKLSAEAASAAEQIRTQLLSAHLGPAKAVYSSCKKNMEQFGKDNVTGAGARTSTAYKTFIALQNGEKNERSQKFLKALEGETNNVTCVDATGDIQKAYGDSLSTVASAMSNQTDPDALSRMVEQFLAAVSTAPSNFSKQVRTSIDACNESDKKLKKIDSWIARHQAKMGRSARSSQGGSESSTGTTARRVGNTGPGTGSRRGGNLKENSKSSRGGDHT